MEMAGTPFSLRGNHVLNCRPLIRDPSKELFLGGRSSNLTRIRTGAASGNWGEDDVILKGGVGLTGVCICHLSGTLRICAFHDM